MFLTNSRTPQKSTAPIEQRADESDELVFEETSGEQDGGMITMYVFGASTYSVYWMESFQVANTSITYLL